MSKRTEKFNVTVTLGKKVYKPGEPVPVGASGGLSDDEVKNLRTNFGDYNGGPDASEGPIPSSADLARIRDEFAKLTSERDELQGDVDRLTAERDTAFENSKALSKKNDELEAENDAFSKDNQVLADQVKALQGQVKTLEANIEKLTVR
ncbi:hypothetical protein FA04_13855 [Ensifer adhaerens]|uniref:Uncharacterized protein n=1 Tax=Ensifer adhaerens TaxID=106592 RepID=A0ABY8HDX2_ENSAD|nr:hypothetical protein [Ensifer adhaerens]ANK73608.1 hypothetical protein FA04_13855 [Ensifer adhaerens]KDP73634.1 hypothetical protein FA04_11055 [Ensifer adhaerens]WFP89684.1 hypothetical protein P4B07_14080 [Ensifer adhaerens]